MYYVLVTGASKGIGRATALYLDALGYGVLAGVRKQADADALREAGSEHLTPIFVDVTAADSIAAAAEQVGTHTGETGLYGLVNNAGVAVPGPLEFLPMADFRWQFEVNVHGQVAVTQAMLPHLRRASGRVIMMSSISGKRAVPFVGAYAASKHAIEALTDALRQELHPWGMHVVSILPGVIDTPIWEDTTARVKARIAQNALPPAAFDLYGGILNDADVLARRGKQSGIPAQIVAETVAKALYATTPHARYFVGKDAQLARLLAWAFPARWLDALMRQL